MTPVRREDYRPPAFRVDHVALRLDLDAAVTRVDARLDLRRDSQVAPDTPLRLDGVDLVLHGVDLDGRALERHEYRHEDTGLVVFDTPARFSLTTEVTLRPEANTALMGLYSADGLLCTQCEPEAFRRITFYPDRPDVLAPFRVTLVADPARYPVMLANGNPVNAGQQSDGRHWVCWEDPFPKPAYLFAVVAGKLQCCASEHVTASGRRVPLRLYVPPGDAGRGEYALAALGRAMAWDEACYGREYDLSVLNLVAVPQYTMGAMENKGLLVFNDRYLLADPQTATDDDYRNIEALVGHEYFHNWSGNRVTCRDWFQLALKEGFTVLREQQFVTDQGWAAARRLADMVLMRRRQFVEDAGPLRHPVRPESYLEIENFYTDTVYSKGAEIIRMLAVTLGAEGFRAGTDRYFAVHDGDAVTIEAFIECLASATGRDLGAFLAWYDRPGTPALECVTAYDEAAGSLSLRVCQREPGTDAGTAALPMPLAVGLLDTDGRELPVRLAGESWRAPGTRVLSVQGREQSFTFTGLDGPPVPALLRGFSAPVRLHYAFAESELVTLVRHDPDACVRWDAMQRLVAWAVASRLEGGGDGTASLTASVAGLLHTASVAPLVTATLLTLPDAGSLVQETDLDDVAAVDRALEELQRAIVGSVGPALARLHRACRGTDPDSRGTADVGRRALGIACLRLLAGGHWPGARGLCRSLYESSGALTERLAALEMLAHAPDGYSEQALADCRERWANTPAMLEKWFALQARSRRADALARVEVLTVDPAFSLQRPNRVRSLVGAFCEGNPRHFHRSDGAGYRFLAQRVLEIDSSNPALAAELLRSLASWHCHEPNRSSAMRAALRHVAAAPGLSPASTEVAARALAR